MLLPYGLSDWGLAQMGRALGGVAWTIKADAAVDTERVLFMPDFPGSGVLIRAAKGWFPARMVNARLLSIPSAISTSQAYLQCLTSRLEC
jgi:hypothetical protein